MNPELKRQLLTTLRTQFKLQQFRPNQLAIITNILDGVDVMALLPTGSGKSLCYQLPAIFESKVSIVISPLLALITDQISFLNQLGIGCAYFNSQTSFDERMALFNDLKNPQPKCRLLYTTPETLINNLDFQTLLKNLYQRRFLSRIVIDEAHCVSNWGHDFRESYLELKQLKTIFKNIQIVTLTATATPIVQNDIRKQLGLKNTHIHRQSFIRPNLSYQIRPKSNARVIVEMADLIKNKYTNQSGIIYCFSRQNCEDVTEELQSLGISCEYFHAKMNPERKPQVQAQWLNNTTQVIVATIAFGLGINKPDVRFVFHHSMPKSIEGYYQETGRAGRDGQPSDCILFYSGSDRHKLEWVCKKDAEDNNEAPTTNLYLIEKMSNFCKNTIDCRKRILSNYLGEYMEFKCDLTQPCCDNCRSGRHHRSSVINLKSHYNRIVDLFNTQVSYNWETLSACLLIFVGLCQVDVDRLITQLIVNKFFKIANLSDTISLLCPLVEHLVLVPLDSPAISSYLKPKSKVKSKMINESLNENGHQIRFNQLVDLRQKVSTQTQLPIGQIFGDSVINELCELNPQSYDDLIKVKSLNAEKMLLYGDAILTIFQTTAPVSKSRFGGSLL